MGPWTGGHGRRGGALGDGRPPRPARSVSFIGRPPLSRLSLSLSPQGGFKFHQYQVVGRHLPTEADPEPTLYRMKLWATDEVREEGGGREGEGEGEGEGERERGRKKTRRPPVPRPPALPSPKLPAHTPAPPRPAPPPFPQVRAKSKFWYFLRKLRKVKKANGQVVACHEIFEARPTTVKNFGIWVRYASRTGEHNAYKEYRDTTLNGAVAQLYEEMGSRHRVRAACLQIIKTATVPAAAAKREATKQFHSKAIRFPLTTRRARPESRVYRTIFKAVRPNVAMQ